MGHFGPDVADFGCTSLEWQQAEPAVPQRVETSTTDTWDALASKHPFTIPVHAISPWAKLHLSSSFILFATTMTTTIQAQLIAVPGKMGAPSNLYLIHDLCPQSCPQPGHHTASWTGNPRNLPKIFGRNLLNWSWKSVLVQSVLSSDVGVTTEPCPQVPHHLNALKDGDSLGTFINTWQSIPWRIFFLIPNLNLPLPKLPFLPSLFPWDYLVGNPSQVWINIKTTKPIKSFYFVSWFLQRQHNMFYFASFLWQSGKGETYFPFQL